MPRMIKILSPPPIHLDEGKATNTEPAIDRTHYIIKSRPIIELAISFPHRNNRESGFAILLCQRPSIQGTAPPAPPERRGHHHHTVISQPPPAVSTPALTPMP